jgi:hypothetical protein
MTDRARERLTVALQLVAGLGGLAVAVALAANMNGDTAATVGRVAYLMGLALAVLWFTSPRTWRKP